MSGHVDLVKEQFFAFRDNQHQGAVHLLNLIRLRERADYPDGRDASGVEAYQTYGRVSEAVLARVGAKIIWEGQFESMLIGPGAEHWDLCFVAEYPSVLAFVEIIRDPVYREAAAHRKAAALDFPPDRIEATPGSNQVRAIPRRSSDVISDITEARAFAEEWIAAWNAHDLDRILSHYSPEVVLLSPIAQRRVGNGRVEGLTALRGYWNEGLIAQPELKFELLDTLLGHLSLTIVYRTHRGQKATETFEFQTGGHISRSVACYS